MVDSARIAGLGVQVMTDPAPATLRAHGLGVQVMSDPIPPSGLPDPTGLVRWWAADDFVTTDDEALLDRVLGAPGVLGSTVGVDVNDPLIVLDPPPAQLVPDGIDDYLQTDYTPTFTATTGELTVVLVGVYDDGDTAQSFRRFFSFESASNQGVHFNSAALTESRVRITIGGDVSTGGIDAPGGDTLVDGEAFVAAVVVDNGDSFAYLHGQGLSSALDISGMGVFTFNSGRVGSRAYEISSNLNSSIRHALIFERALGEVELDALAVQLEQVLSPEIRSTFGLGIRSLGIDN